MQLRRHRAELAVRVRRLRWVVQGFLVLIAAGYWSVQVADGAYYRELADHNRLRRTSLEAPRGLILDRQGRPLVENSPSYTLQLDRSRSEDLEASVAFAADVLGDEPEVLRETLVAHRSTPRFKPVVLRRDLDLVEVSRFAVHHLEHPEFEIVAEHQRLYRYAHQTAHLLGYLGEVGEGELTREGTAYRGGELVGRKGLEKRYEDLLRGERGEQVVVVDSRGRTIDELDQEAAQPGRTLRLALDLELQQEAMRLLEGKVGSLVALDPRTGEIVAMASSPSFDPNLFARRISTEDWRQLADDPQHPLQNRAVQNTYPPASVFKIVMAAAGLDLGVLDPDERVYCRGWSRIYGHRYRCGKASGHGSVDLDEALRGSCNVYFHQLGQRLGIDRIAEYARRFGFDRRTGLDLDGERSGLVPDTSWSLAERDMPWYPGETISVATGQGPILVTPLQMATMMAAVANGGTLVVPHLRAGGLEKAGELGISEEHLDRVRRGLWEVVNHPRGTGRNARIDGFELAGKTGTAQVVRQETWTKNKDLAAERRDHSWFAAYGPFEDPRLVVVVMVEHGGAGSQVAAPMAREFYARYLQNDLAHRSAS